MSPASMTMMSSPQRMAMQFMPNSPRPPRGTTWSLPVGIRAGSDASTAQARRRHSGYTCRMAPRTSLVHRVQQMVRTRLLQAYDTVQVEPGHFLQQLRRAHGLQVNSYRELQAMDIRVLDSIARSTIRGARKIAAVEGAGLGFGGMLTLLPDIGILAAISVRTVQKLSLIYGFEYSTDEERAELWLALATAAGVDITRDLVEKEVIERFVPRVVERIAAKVGVEVAE